MCKNRVLSCGILIVGTLAVRHRLYGLLGAAVILLGGCGRSDLAQVVGKVTFNGEPIKKGHIVLEPKQGRSARGSIVNGELVDIHTYEKGDGVRVGEHKVSIIAFVREPKGMEIPPSLIPHRYENPSSSGLTAVVESGKTNELLFELVD